MAPQLSDEAAGTPPAGLTAVGGMVLAGGGVLPASLAQALAGAAVLVSAVNIGGGFAITQVRGWGQGRRRRRRWGRQQHNFARPNAVHWQLCVAVQCRNATVYISLETAD